MYHIKGMRNVVVLCTLVTYCFTKANPKTELHVRKKIFVQKNKQANIPTTKKEISSALEAPRITIWLHGTKSMSFISDFVHAAPNKGLLLANDLSAYYRIKRVIKTLATSDAKRFPLEHFYVYGWSGKLCFKKRLNEAIKLYAAINDLVHQHTTPNGIAPHITLITHSHGGNVALNLATIAHKDPALNIELIMLACPVQHETKTNVQSPLFERIYSFYSPADVMQIVDPQGLYITEHNAKLHFELSERVFPSHSGLRQMMLEINGHGITHLGFILERTIRMLPTLLNAAEEWESEEPSISGTERILEVTTPDWKKPSSAMKVSSSLRQILRI